MLPLSRVRPICDMSPPVLAYCDCEKRPIEPAVAPPAFTCVRKRKHREGKRVCGCVGMWVCGCVGVWVFGCVRVNITPIEEIVLS